MLDIYICEDNPEHHKKIEKCVSDYILMEGLEARVALSTGDPEKIIAGVKENPTTGLYLLDVDLNAELNGITLAEQIRKYDPRGYIIFITVRADDMQLTFKYKVEALDYIVKGDFGATERRLRECIANAYEKYTSKADRGKFVFKIADNRTIALDKGGILFFETLKASPRKLCVYSTDSRYEFYAKLSDIEKVLGGGFVRCHRSYIVNVKNIESVNRRTNVVRMTDGSRCFMSVRYGKALVKAMEGGQKLSARSSIV